MSWGLEGFLDIFLRNGSVSDVLPESLSLFIFGSGHADPDDDPVAEAEGGLKSDEGFS